MKITTGIAVALCTASMCATVCEADFVYATYDGTNAASGYAIIDCFTNEFELHANRFASFGPFLSGATNSFRLTRVTLNIEMIAGSSSNLIVQIWTNQSLGGPAGYLATLTSSVPVSTQNNYDFFAATEVILDPERAYSVVVSPAFVDGTYFAWHYNTPDYAQDSGWRGEGADGIWTGFTQSSGNETAYIIYAEVVPEPSTFLLLGIGCLCLVKIRRRHIS